MKFAVFLLLLLAQSCSHVFYQPSSRQYIDPAQYNIKYEDVYFESLDKTRLHGWFLPATQKKVKGTVLHFHGNAQNISTHFLNLHWMTKEGYNVFIFDYRGYWKSQGKPDQEGVYNDALAALEKGHELNQKHGKGIFVVYGQSLGGIISLRALADYKNLEEVDLIVQDSTFSSYKDLAFNKLTSRWFLIPFSPLAYVLVSDKYASDKVFEKIRRPTLVIAGHKDEVILKKFGREIYEGIKSEQKWLWEVPEGKHIDVFHHDGEDYRMEFLKLLEKISKK